MRCRRRADGGCAAGSDCRLRWLGCGRLLIRHGKQRLEGAAGDGDRRAHGLRVEHVEGSREQQELAHDEGAEHGHRWNFLGSIDRFFRARGRCDVIASFVDSFDSHLELISTALGFEEITPESEPKSQGSGLTITNISPQLSTSRAGLTPSRGRVDRRPRRK